MYKFVKINENYFDELLQWKYQNEFSCYDMDGRLTTIDEVYDRDNYDLFLGFDENEEVIGFLECFYDDEGILEIRNGLNPVFIGQGISCDFISSSVEFAIEEYEYDGDIVRIKVEPFNERAIRVYLRIGFVKIEENPDFVLMELILQ